MPHIEVNDLCKSFVVPVKNERYGWMRNMLRPDKKTILAVDNITFDVPKGQAVAFIGPNGAGKSTTIKMLTGILHPTSGSIRVAGIDPQRARRKLAFKIGTLFGQRSQLLPNLPVGDSFEMFGALYELSSPTIVRRRKELTKLLMLEEFLDIPVRKLSLGQRMRAEIAVALLHRPEIVFLDEPTIGLDVVAKRQLREALAQLNKKEGVTLFLTSHDPGDVEVLCERTIVVNHGRIVVDEKTADLRAHYMTKNITTMEDVIRSIYARRR